MGLVQGITQGVQTKQAADALKKANRELTGRMYKSQLEYEARRPQQAADRMAALRQQMGIYNPANNMVGEMTGGRYKLDLNAPTQNPLGMKPTLAQMDRGNEDSGGWGGGSPEWQQSRINELRAQGYDTNALQSQQRANSAESQKSIAAAGNAIRNGVASVIRGKK